MAAPVTIKPGDQVGSLTVLHVAETAIANKKRMMCRCRCGAKKAFYVLDLVSAAATCCGCMADPGTHAARAHAWKKSATYVAWTRMIAACSDPSSSSYADCGGREIDVISRWSGVGGFTAFLTDMGVCPPRYQLARIDLNRQFEQANCKWTRRRTLPRHRRAD